MSADKVESPDPTILNAIQSLAGNITAMEERLNKTMKSEFTLIREEIDNLKGESDTRRDAIIEMDERLKNQEAISASIISQISIITDAIKLQQR